MYLKNSFEILYVSIALLPVAIAIGPLISDSIISLIALFFLVTKYKKLFNEIKNNKLIQLILVFCVLNIINSLFAEKIFLSLKSSFLYLRFPLFILAISFALRKNNKYCLYIFYGLLIAICFVSLDAIIQFFFGKNFLGYIAHSRNRISGIFNDEYILGSYLTRLTPILISLYFFLKDKKKINLFLFLFTCLISFIAVLISGERTSIFLNFIFYIFLIFFLTNFSFKKKIIMLSFISSAIFVSIYSSENLKTRYIDLTLLEIKSFFITEQKSDSMNEDYYNQRLKHLEVSYEMFKEKKYFGYGNKMFAHICFSYFFIDDGRCSTHPHNFTAQILVENGLVGFSLFMFIFLFFIKELLKNRKSKVIFPLLLIITITIFPLFPSGNFYNNQISIFLYFPLSIYLFYCEFYKELNNKTKKDY